MQSTKLYDTYSGREIYSFNGQKVKEYEGGSIYMSDKGEFYETQMVDGLTKVFHYRGLADMEEFVSEELVDEIVREMEL